jgi:hypothetical protein
MHGRPVQNISCRVLPAKAVRPWFIYENKEKTCLFRVKTFHSRIFFWNTFIINATLHDKCYRRFIVREKYFRRSRNKQVERFLLHCSNLLPMLKYSRWSYNFIFQKNIVAYQTKFVSMIFSKFVAKTILHADSRSRFVWEKNIAE